jgi:hypothetical protein
MAYQRKFFRHIAAGQERAVEIQGIDPVLDLGSYIAISACNAGIAAECDNKRATSRRSN